jgi:hypothetical protein
MRILVLQKMLPPKIFATPGEMFLAELQFGSLEGRPRAVTLRWSHTAVKTAQTDGHGNDVRVWRGVFQSNSSDGFSCRRRWSSRIALLATFTSVLTLFQFSSESLR